MVGDKMPGAKTEGIVGKRSISDAAVVWIVGEIGVNSLRGNRVCSRDTVSPKSSLRVPYRGVKVSRRLSQRPFIVMQRSILRVGRLGIKSPVPIT